VNAVISIDATTQCPSEPARCLNATRRGDETATRPLEVLCLVNVSRTPAEVDAQVVEDPEGADQHASRALMRPSSSPVGMPGALAGVGGGCELHGLNIPLVMTRSPTDDERVPGPSTTGDPSRRKRCACWREGARALRSNATWRRPPSSRLMGVYITHYRSRGMTRGSWSSLPTGVRRLWRNRPQQRSPPMGRPQEQIKYK